MATGSTNDNATTGFRVETLLHSLKELQNEKQCLEQKLNNQRSARRSLENTMESVNAKCGQVKDVHQRMSGDRRDLHSLRQRYAVEALYIGIRISAEGETLKVAQNKVSRTQAQAQSLEETNQRKREKIAELHKLIEDEKENQMKQVYKFQDNLSAASAYLMKSKNLYSEEYLGNELQALEQRKALLRNKVEEYSLEFSELNDKIEKLTLNKDRGDEFMKDIPIEQRKIVLQIIEDENARAKEHLEQVLLKVKEAENNLDAINGENGAIDSLQ